VTLPVGQTGKSGRCLIRGSGSAFACEGHRKSLKPQSGQAICRPRLDLSTSHLRRRSASRWTSALGLFDEKWV